MDDRANVSAVELLELLATVIGSLVITAIGLSLEVAALANVLAGEVPLGVWEGVLGLLALYAGLYLVGYQRAWPKLRSLQESSA